MADYTHIGAGLEEAIRRADEARRAALADDERQQRDRAERERQQQEETARAQERWVQAVQASGIPPHLADLLTDSERARAEIRVAPQDAGVADAIRRQCPTVLVWGEPETGKTWTLCRVLAWRMRSAPGAYLTAWEVATSATSYSRDREQHAHWAGLSTLVVDEVSDRALDRKQRNRVGSLIKRRHDAGRLTLIAGNVGEGEPTICVPDLLESLAMPLRDRVMRDSSAISASEVMR
jgi:hypothetical protein